MKKVESIWAELSAKAQEVAQESTELSEEVKVDLSMASDIESNVYEVEATLKSVNKLKSQMDEEVKNLDAIEKRLRLYEKDLEEYARDLGAKSPYLNDVQTALKNIDKIRQSI